MQHHGKWNSIMTSYKIIRDPSPKVEVQARVFVCLYIVRLGVRKGNQIKRSFIPQSVQNFLLHPDTLRQMTPEQTASDDDEVNVFLRSDEHI